MGKAGFTRDSRIRKSWEFEQVYSRGRRLRGQGFMLVCTTNSLGYNRIGISVHRKLRGAVKRNRIKRIIRESFRLRREVYPPDADIVFTVRPGFALSSPESVSRAVLSLTGRLNNANEA